MPKKQNARFTFTNNNSYVHPSLGGGKGNAPANSSKQESMTSVNARVEYLRRAQTPMVSPNENQGMQASRHAPAPTAPPGRRRVAGPAPPRSWVVGSDTTPSLDGSDDTLPDQRPRLNRLPGVEMPRANSLRDIALRSMATDLDWHVEFDHSYLSTLPIELKMQLLSYVAVYSKNGFTREGLSLLFEDPHTSELEDSTGSQDVSRLDLGRSVGRALSLPELDRLWKRKRHRSQPLQREESVLESWEDDVDLSSLSLTSSVQFPRLTRLSLAHPAKAVSWQDLVKFSYQLGSLTHLCLDFWPRPSLPEMQPTLPQHKSLLDHPAVGVDQSKEAESGVLLRMLSRNTPSLKWVSVAGCQVWFDALLPQEDDDRATATRPRLQATTRDLETMLARPDHANRLARLDRETMSNAATNSTRGPDWNGCWKNIRYVNISQDWIPRNCKSDDLVKLVIPRKARSVNREALRAEPFQLPRDRERETYRLSSGSDEVQRSIEDGLRKRRWLLMERMSILLASKVDWKRLQGDLPTAEFDFGWGRPELLAAGYEEQIVFDAGL